jgi:signal transduction histidine kinase
MSYNFTVLCYVRFISGLIALVLACWLWKRKNSQGALYLLFFELACAIWAIADGFEAAATSVSLKLHWAQIAYIGVTFSAVMFLLFALSYTNPSRQIKRKTLLLLLIIPILTLAVAFTNTMHQLLWSKIIILEGTFQSVYYYGPWFWVNVTYEYSALTIGIIVLLVGAFKVFSLFRTQLWFLVIGTLLPFITSITYIFKLTPFKGIDPTPIAFIISGLVVAISLYWLKMFNIMPIARQQAIDNLNDGMLIIDSQYRVVYVNPSFCKIVELTKREALGKQVDLVFSGIGITMNMFSVDNDYTLEFNMGGAANMRSFEIKCSKVVNEKNQKLLGRIYMIADVTTKKMILDAIADSNNRKKIEIIEKEKLILDLDAYARSVAHDLKNPISSVVSLSELIRLELSENNLKEVVEMVNMVQSQSEKMVRIIDDLLILSRIRKEDVEICPIDIKKILHVVLERLAKEISSGKVTFEMPEFWPNLLGNDQWIEEVLINIISNGIKYGGDPPHLKLGFVKENNNICRIWVQDNGNGLPAESLGKIFEDFERLGRKDIQGHGLGLSIVKRIIGKLGGDVKVESSNIPGEGCKFSFTMKEDRGNQ